MEKGVAETVEVAEFTPMAELMRDIRDLGGSFWYAVRA